MNIEKLLAFYQAGQQLREEGVIGTRDFGERLHVMSETIINMDNLQIESRNCKDFPYEISVTIDGMKIFALATANDVKHLPQFKAVVKAELESRVKELQEYMIDDVNLSGDENVAI